MNKLFVIGLLVAGSAQAQTATVVELTSSPDKKIAVLEQMLTQKNRVQVQMQQHIDTLQQEINELRGVTETHEYRLNQILQRQRELYQELDKLSSRLSVPVPVESNDSIVTDNNTAQVALSESEAYDRALSLVLKGKQYDKAIVEFKQYLVDFPQSSYVPNVHYWLGQLLFTKGDKNQAKQQFNALVNDFTDSSKRADAMVKLGQIEQDLNNAAQAKVLYNKVLKEYPESGAAQIARTRLKGIK